MKLMDLWLFEDDASAKELRSILKQNYKTFVSKLGAGISDPKFVAAIKAFAQTHPIKTKVMDIPVQKLKPTQNEIVMTNTLFKPLTKPEISEKCLRGGTLAVSDRLIVTAGNGKFIVDGHHRWSRLFCLNPDAKIKAMDISNIEDPIEALKATQLGVAAQIKKVPSEQGGGINLLRITKEVLGKYISRTITKEVLAVFAKYGRGTTPEEVTEYIWKNVKMLQAIAKPVTGAPPREIMPQTEKAPKFKDTAVDVANIGESDYAKKQLARKRKFAITYNQ